VNGSLLASSPPKARTCRPRAEDRYVINGILYVLITGYRWMDMSINYSSYKTAWKRLKCLEKWKEAETIQGRAIQENEVRCREIL
jgi:transposase